MHILRKLTPAIFIASACTASLPPTDQACVPVVAGPLALDSQNCGGCGPCHTDVYDFGVVGNSDLGVVRIDEVQWLCCGGRCVDFFNDPTNCGNCGARCQLDKTCVKGHCS